MMPDEKPPLPAARAPQRPSPRNDRVAWRIMLACTAALACGPKSQDAPPADAKPAEAPAPSGEADAAAPSGAGADAPAEAQVSGTSRLLGYLDPEARAVLVTRIDRDFDPVVLATVMGLPPGAAGLLEARHRVIEGLEATSGESLEQVMSWLGPEMLVMTPQVAVQDYVLATTSAKADALAEKFEKAGMQSTKLEDRTFWLPTGPFGFKVTLLEPGLLAFIPAQELGSGMSPLTAGRDLAPSQMRTQLEQMLAGDDAIVMALHAGGPMLHLDLHGDVNASQLGLRRAAQGYDAQVVLQPVAPLDEAAKTLAAREHPEESQQVQALMKRVKFVVDREALIGEIHLDDADFELLQ